MRCGNGNMMREMMQVRSGSVREFAHGLVRVADGKEDLARLLRVAEDRHRGDGFKRGCCCSCACSTVTLHVNASPSMRTSFVAGRKSTFERAM